jgi:hypothetical protein
MKSYRQMRIIGDGSRLDQPAASERLLWRFDMKEVTHG